MAKARPAKREASGGKNPGARVRKGLADVKPNPWGTQLGCLQELAIWGEAPRRIYRIIEVIAQIQSVEASLAAGEPALPPGFNPHEAPHIPVASLKDWLRHFLATRHAELGAWLARATPQELETLARFREAMPLRGSPATGWIVSPADPGLLAAVNVAYRALELRDQDADLGPEQYLEAPTREELAEWIGKVAAADREEIARAAGIHDTTLRKLLKAHFGAAMRPGRRPESR